MSARKAGPRRSARAGRGGDDRAGPRRPDRVGREVRAILAELLIREARDPSMSAIIVTDVKLTSDLTLARVYYRLLLGEDALVEGRRAAARGLKRASGWMRSELGGRLELRVTPELEFHYDEGQDRAMRVDSLLGEIGAAKATGSGAGAGAGAEPGGDDGEKLARREEDDLDDDDLGVDDDEDDDDDPIGEPPEDED